MSKLIQLLTAIGLPYAYDHFAEGESPQPPFVCCLIPDTDNFAADGMAYFKINNVCFELYTDKKEPATEKLVEDVLDLNGIFYDKSETWIDSEKLFEVIYSFQMEDQ